MTFVINSQNMLTTAKQTVGFGLEGAVIDRFRLRDLTIGPLPDLFRGSKTDLDRFKSNIILHNN